MSWYGPTHSSDWCIANAAPFRGVSMDVGTAFEIGYMVAAGKVVYAYTDHPAHLGDRHRAMQDDNAALRETTGDGWRIEMFGHVENLMIPFGILLALGAVGLGIGLVVPVLGIAAAIGLVLYFVCALGAHLRVHDRGIGGAVGFLLLALAVLAADIADRGLD